MTETTPLDAAHAAMMANAGDDAARLRFFERLADSELFVLLEREAEGDTIAPELFDTGEGAFVLVFDREDRLAQFVGAPAPYAGLSGRALAALLAGRGIGLGLNLEVAPSSILVPAEGIDWLAGILAAAPDQIAERPEELRPPAGLPERFVAALDTKLATAAGLAKAAYLVAVSYAGGARGHMLGFVGARPGAEAALAQATGEALTFSGIEAGALDVGFFGAGDAIVARLDKVGLRFDLPQVVAEETPVRAAPGSDPSKPPILR